jgi:ectoine hydroxylase-related dioxygenase (phytanoyl-CoA dioxygenase family)
MTFWIPLEAYGPEAGTMSFISGSHRMGVLGDYQTYGGGDALDVYPELRDLPVVGPMHYAVGDVTVHSEMVVHGAGANTTDKPRWAYTIFAKPADIRWTGAPCPSMDSTGMAPFGPFPDDRYPIIG